MATATVPTRATVGATTMLSPEMLRNMATILDMNIVVTLKMTTASLEMTIQVLGMTIQDQGMTIQDQRMVTNLSRIIHTGMTICTGRTITPGLGTETLSLRGEAEPAGGAIKITN